MVSIIIPCFNAQMWIRETLQSALGQGIGDIEIIVVDDGSTDKSASIIEKEFPSVHLIKTENHGPSRARNLGTKLSRGDFIQYLDHDDLLAPEKLNIQLKALRESGADVAYGNWQKLVKAETGVYVKWETIGKKISNPEIEIATCEFVCPPAVYLFRRSIVEKTGGWDEGLFIVQDARFLFDCVVHNAAFIYCDSIMMYCREAPTSLFRRDTAASNRDMLQYTRGIEKWWTGHGGVNKERRKALVKLYGHITRSSFENDKGTFEKAYQSLHRWSPGYIPQRPVYLKLASMILGYRRAEAAAAWYKRIGRHK